MQFFGPRDSYSHVTEVCCISKTVVCLQYLIADEGATEIRSPMSNENLQHHMLKKTPQPVPGTNVEYAQLLTVKHVQA